MANNHISKKEKLYKMNNVLLIMSVILSVRWTSEVFSKAGNPYIQVSTLDIYFMILSILGFLTSFQYREDLKS